MASPGSIAASDDAASKPVEQITFRFCSECSNMLYPKEDPDNNRLQFTCRTCHYTEEASSTCVFRNVMNTSAGETAGVTQDVGSDPTVGDFPRKDSLLAPEMCFCCGNVLQCSQCDEPSGSFVVTASPTTDYDPAIMDELDDTDEMDEMYGVEFFQQLHRNNATVKYSSHDMYRGIGIDDTLGLGYGIAITLNGDIIEPGLHSPMANEYLEWSSETGTDSSDEEMTDF